MNLSMTRRSVLAALAAILPAVTLGRSAKAITEISASDAKFPMPHGLWVTLEHATDGLNPSTALSEPPPARFTPEIRALVGQQIELSGYLTPLAAGFGKSKDYLLSRETFHCPYCYAFGRASLALATFDGHVPSTEGKVTVVGTLALQENDPSDFYFQLQNSKII